VFCCRLGAAGRSEGGKVFNGGKAFPEEDVRRFKAFVEDGVLDDLYWGLELPIQVSSWP
jgi:hypothetical protein